MAPIDISIHISVPITHLFGVNMNYDYDGLIADRYLKKV